jgi:hypothetical protein
METFTWVVLLAERNGGGLTGTNSGATATIASTYRPHGISMGRKGSYLRLWKKIYC